MYSHGGEILDLPLIDQFEHADIQVGCLSTPLISAVASELCRSGILDLDAPVGEFFPELRTSTKGRLIRVQHLMSNTAGYSSLSRIPTAHAFSDRRSALESIRRSPQMYWPGHVYSYDNSTSVMLGEILQVITGANVPDLVSELVYSQVRCGAAIGHHSVEYPRWPPIKQGNQDKHRSLFDSRISFPCLLGLAEWFMLSKSCDQMRRAATIIPRASGSSSSQLLPICYGFGLQGFSNGFFGYDTNTKCQANGFRFNAEKGTAVVLSTRGRYRSLRRAALSEAAKSIIASSSDGCSAMNASANRALPISGNHSGDYFGHDRFYARIMQRSNELEFTVHSYGGGRIRMVGSILPHGHLRFESKVPAADPTFFKYLRTGELCLMFGMFALKRLPSAAI
jgi:hypothetical protein